MKAILIDSSKKLITPHELSDDGSERASEIQKLLGCSCISVTQGVVIKSNGDEEVVDVFIDDNGFLCNPEHFFCIAGCGQPLAGNGLVVGPPDDVGSSTDAPCGLIELAANVRFLDSMQLLLEVLNE